jgi:hypothetical protein
MRRNVFETAVLLYVVLLFVQTVDLVDALAPPAKGWGQFEALHGPVRRVDP